MFTRLLAVLPILAWVQDDPASLIRRLGSERPEEREAATRGLVRLGKAARPAIEEATRDPDPEVAGRARDILDELDSRFESAVEFFGRLCRSESASYHRLLRRAHHWKERALFTKDWDEVLAALRLQEIEPTDVWERGGFTTYRFLLRKGAFALASGRKLDLFLEFDVVRAFSRTERTRGTIRSAEVGLRGEVRALHADILKRALLGSGTALQKAVESEPIVKESARFPGVHAVEITYKQLRDRRSEIVPFGFDVRIEMVDHLEGRIRNGRSFLSIESGLDAPRTWKGGPALPRLAAGDTLGEVRGGGGNSSSPMGRGLKRLDLPATREPFHPMGYSKEIPPQAWSLPDLAALPEEISSLRIEGDFLPDEEAKALDRFKGLRILHWCRAKPGDAAMPVLASLPALEHLCIAAERITDDGFRALGRSPRLQRLYVSRAALLTDEGMRHLGGIGRLSALELRSCPRVTDAGLRHLAVLGGLADLDLWTGAPITDAGFLSLERLKKLRSLKLGEMDGLSAAGIAVLGRMPALRELWINYSPVDDAWLAEIGRIKDLEFFAYYQRRDDGRLTDDGLMHLKGLTNLRRLNLYSERLTDAGMQKLEEALPGRYFRY